MEKVVRQMALYHKLYIASLLIAVFCLGIAVALLLRWEVYRSIKTVRRKQEAGKRKVQKEEVINEKTNTTVKLKMGACDATELIGRPMERENFRN